MPPDLARDSHVDLVVCSVRVDKRYNSVLPALKAGKDVHVEWPLGKNLQESEDLLRISQEYHVKNTVVGLQGRISPPILKLKELIADGKIGKVLSSYVYVQAGIGGDTLLHTNSYLADKELGGNLMTIHFGHTVDNVQQGMFHHHPIT